MTVTTKTLNQTVYACLGELLEYPGADFPARVESARAALAEEYAESAGLLEGFYAEIAGKTVTELEELYTQTFDFSLLSAPYVSVHLFGDQSFKRSQLMAGLVEAYGRAGFDRGSELPDHLAVILRFAPYFSDAEWAEMAECCVRVAAVKLHETLERGGNPYRRVLGALIRAIDDDYPEEPLNV